MPNDFWVRHQKWSVYWYSKKRGKFVRKRFHEDVGGAIKFYTENLDRTGITLHADNHGYPPPLRITEHERETWEIVRRKGKKFKKKVITVVNLMEEYNRKGIWWCPYCIKLRRFEEVETERGVELCCPVCWVSHFMVRNYNPLASQIEFHTKPQRTSSAKRRKR